MYFNRFADCKFLINFFVLCTFSLLFVYALMNQFNLWSAIAEL